MQVLANAKINLTLDVTGKRNDGYHMLESIFLPIPFYDSIEIHPAPKITVSTNLPFLPTDSRNLAYQAAEKFFTFTGRPGGVRIKIHKKIPVGGGVGGGSSNAAAVLRALNRIYDTHLSRENMLSLARELGADVPFYILNSPAFATGIGDILEPLPPMPPVMMILVIPRFSVNTRWAFKNFNWQDPNLPHPNNPAAIAAIKAGDLHALCQNLGNVLEPCVASAHPAIQTIKQELLSQGALAAQMTGSGSTVFALFDPDKPRKNFVFPHARTLFFPPHTFK